MRDRLAELGRDTRVVLVTFSEAEALSHYVSSHQVPFPVLADAGRATYRAYGLGRGSLRRVYGLRTARRYLQIFRNDGLSGLRRPTEDTRQLGGDFVIDQDGLLSYGFWGDGPDDRPEVADLVEAVASARRDRPTDPPTVSGASS